MSRQQQRNRQRFGDARTSLMQRIDPRRALQMSSYRLAEPLTRRETNAAAPEGLRMAAIREANADSAQMALLSQDFYISPGPFPCSPELQLQARLDFGGAGGATQFAPPDLVSPSQRQRGSQFLLPRRGDAGGGGVAAEESALSAAISLSSDTLSQGSSAAHLQYGLISAPAPSHEAPPAFFDSCLGQNDAPQWGGVSSLQSPSNSAEFISPQFDYPSMMPDLEFDSMQALADGQLSFQFGTDAIAPYNAQQQVGSEPWSVYNGIDQFAWIPLAGFDSHLDLSLPLEPGYVALAPEHPRENFEAARDNADFIEEKIGNNGSNQSAPLTARKGGRKRELKPEQKAKAANMRKVMACKRCRLQRTSCDSGTPCQRCRAATLNTAVCFREPLASYVSLLFREPLASRNSDKALEKLMSQTVGSFTDNYSKIDMTSGALYPAMQFVAREFSPKDPEALELKIVNLRDVEPQTRLHKSYAVPFVLCGRNVEDRIATQVNRHVHLICNGVRNLGETQEFVGDIAVLPFQLFEAVNEYQKASNAGDRANVPLLNACRLHTLQSIIARLVPMTEESVRMAASKITKPEVLRFASTVTSKIMDAQIACVVQKLLHERVGDVLKNFEKMLGARRRTVPAWLDAFCIALILCMYFEAVGARMDGILVMEPSKIPISPSHRASYLREVDERLYKPCVFLFHEQFKSRRSGKNGLNLLRDGLRLEDESGVTQSMVHFVCEIRRIMDEHREDIVQRAEHPEFGKYEDLIRDNIQIRKSNSGRLVAKFLLSF